MRKYILVEWPESQILMDSERFNECELADYEIHGPQAYFVPEDLWEEIYGSENN